MGFNEAIYSSFKNYYTFTGRATRAEFWYFLIFITIGKVIALCIDLFIIGNYFKYPPAITLFWLSMIIPLIAVTVRRLHDTDKTGWWSIIIFLVPIIGFLAMLFLCSEAGTKGPNKYDKQPKL